MSLVFTKLFSSITESTVWCESSDVRIVWITMLAMADRHGRVWGTIPGLANRARVSVPTTREAIRLFMEPDPDSRTKDNDGRRIREIDGGWALLNHGKYRAIRDEDERLAYKANKERERRQKMRENTNSNKTNESRGQTRGQNGQTCTGVDSRGHNAEADADTEACVGVLTSVTQDEVLGAIREAVHAVPPGVAEQPGQEPAPSGRVRVMPPRPNPEAENLVDLIVLGSPPGIVDGLTTGTITPVHRSAVIEAAKREAAEHSISKGESYERLLALVKNQVQALPYDRLNRCGSFEKYFAKSVYRKDPIHLQEFGNGKTKYERTRNAGIAAIRADYAHQGASGDDRALAKGGDGRTGNLGPLALLAKLR